MVLASKEASASARPTRTTSLLSSQLYSSSWWINTSSLGTTREASTLFMLPSARNALVCTDANWSVSSAAGTAARTASTAHAIKSDMIFWPALLISRSGCTCFRTFGTATPKNRFGTAVLCFPMPSHEAAATSAEYATKPSSPKTLIPVRSVSAAATQRYASSEFHPPFTIKWFRCSAALGWAL